MRLVTTTNPSRYPRGFDCRNEGVRRLLEPISDHCPVRTVAFHGRPLSRYDNRLWSDARQMHDGFEALDLLGDASEDIDYAEILYINDTGRNWLAERAIYEIA